MGGMGSSNALITITNACPNRFFNATRIAVITDVYDLSHNHADEEAVVKQHLEEVNFVNLIRLLFA